MWKIHDETHGETHGGPHGETLEKCSTSMVGCPHVYVSLQEGMFHFLGHSFAIGSQAILYHPSDALLAWLALNGK